MAIRTTKTCPYCNASLDEVPAKRTPCPQCGEEIRPRQGFLYTQKNLDAYLTREEEAPSPEQMAFMLNLGMLIPPGCTSAEASQLIDYAEPDEEPSPQDREDYDFLLYRIRERMKGGVETSDDVIADPPRSRGARVRSKSHVPPKKSGCAGVLLLGAAVLITWVVKVS